MKNRKVVMIRVSTDNRGVEFHTGRDQLIVPMMPFAVGKDRMNMKSNVNNIVKHIRDMMKVEGYNCVLYAGNDLAVYHEVIHGIKSISGLEVISVSGRTTNDPFDQI